MRLLRDKRFVRLEAALAAREQRAVHLQQMQQKEERRKGIGFIFTRFIVPIIGMASILFLLYAVAK